MVDGQIALQQVILVSHRKTGAGKYISKKEYILGHKQQRRQRNTAVTSEREAPNHKNKLNHHRPIDEKTQHAAQGVWGVSQQCWAPASDEYPRKHARCSSLQLLTINTASNHIEAKPNSTTYGTTLYSICVKPYKNTKRPHVTSRSSRAPPWHLCRGNLVITASQRHLRHYHAPIHESPRSALGGTHRTYPLLHFYAEGSLLRHKRSRPTSWPFNTRVAIASPSQLVQQ